MDYIRALRGYNQNIKEEEEMNENMTSNFLEVEEKLMKQSRKWGMDTELIRKQAIESNNEIIKELEGYETSNKQVALELTVRIVDLKQQNEMLNEPMEPVDQEVQECWQSFWRDILVKNGQLNISQIKKELFDYKYVRDQASLVYSELSGLSKVLYPAQSVINKAREQQKELERGMYLDDIRAMADKSGKVNLSDLEKYFNK
ncbi:hypothetical protein bthur0004_65480 [Bacillus thuringiensis serovar sotto str. T04001]|nr:hypothetical protein bthur0004_65480 [Bacillus thuringiensis serovar sotto str. T04001]